MSYSSSQFDQLSSLSDANCEEGCGLKYGISTEFNRTVLEQQKVKASKIQTQPKTFSSSDDEKIFKHMTEDVMVKIFDAEEEQKIFCKSLEGMRQNYPEILEGKEKNMFYCPTAFNFSSRIGDDETCVPDELDEIKDSLESKGNLSLQEMENLKIIREHLQKLRPELAEQEFVDALACFFYKHRGIFIHSLKFDEHLKVLTNKARDHRKQNKSLEFSLTDFEKKLMDLLNISYQSLVDTSDVIISHLLTKNNGNTEQKVSGKLIQKAIHDELKGNDRMFTKKLFISAKNYTFDEIKDGIILGMFNSQCRVAGENDLFIMLPDSQLIISIEIKRHMKNKSHDLKSAPNIDRNMLSASKQLKKNSQFISSKHGAILSPGWLFVKVCAISPFVYNSDKICCNCNRFVLTSDNLKTPGGLKKWWKATGLSERSTMLDAKSKVEAYTDFQLFFNRLVCMSSVRVVPDPFHTWTQVQGENQFHMAAGHIRYSNDKKNTAEIDEVDAGRMLKDAHHAYKMLSFNKDQMSLLSTDNYPHAIFLCDFGAGKSLIGKEKVLQIGERENLAEEKGLKCKADPVFFISMVGVDEQGKVDEHEHIFDIYTKEYDFLGCEVQVISAQDLWKFYKSRNKEAYLTKVDIYFLVVFFIQRHPDGHYVLDECPFLRRGYSFDANSVWRLKDFVNRSRQLLSSKSNLFWVAIQSNLLADLITLQHGFRFAFGELKQALKNDGWILPELKANMRNQVNIAKVAVERGAGQFPMQTTIEKLKTGSSLIGNIPFLFKVQIADWRYKKDEVLKHCIELISRKSDKNIVVLCQPINYFHLSSKTLPNSQPISYTLKDVENDIKRVISDKNVVSYPSTINEGESISNLKDFVEKSNHILVTRDKYFKGCEAPNVIFISASHCGIRNNLLRAVQNVIYIQITDGKEAKIDRMMEDDRFL